MDSLPFVALTTDAAMPVAVVEESAAAAKNSDVAIPPAGPPAFGAGVGAAVRVAVARWVGPHQIVACRLQIAACHRVDSAYYLTWKQGFVLYSLISPPW